MKKMEGKGRQVIGRTIRQKGSKFSVKRGDEGSKKKKKGTIAPKRGRKGGKNRVA